MVSRSYSNKRGKTSTSYYYECRRDEYGKRKLVPLGTDLIHAKLQWAKLEGLACNVASSEHNMASVNAIHTRYAQWAEDRTRSGLEPRTLLDRRRYWAKIGPVFGNMQMDALRPEHMLKYFDARSSKVSAKKEIKFLSVICNWARSRGYMTAPNPVAGVTRQMKVKETRDIYVTDDMLALVYKHADPIIQDAMDLAYLTGQRPADVLKMRWSQVADNALWVQQGKTKQKLRIDIAGELAMLLDRIKIRGVVGMTILTDPKGQALKPFGFFRSHFDAARNAAAVEAKELGVEFVRFQFRDLRAKAASDIDSMAQARKLLGHTTEQMTRNYVRARIGERVAPIMAKGLSPFSNKS